MKVSQTNKCWSLMAAVAIFLTPITMVQAEDAKGEIGIITCEYVEGSKVNLLIHSSAAFTCVFEHDGGKEAYDGEAGITLGLDLEWTEQSTMAYSVIASTGADHDWSNALNGTYSGGKASAALGIKLGAAALIGGSGDSVGLVPLAVEAGTGFGVSAGLGYLSLKGK